MKSAQAMAARRAINDWGRFSFRKRLMVFFTMLTKVLEIAIQLDKNNFTRLCEVGVGVIWVFWVEGGVQGDNCSRLGADRYS